LTLLKDILREVSSLSLKLQQRSISINEAHDAVDLTVRLLEALKPAGIGGQSSKKLQLDWDGHHHHNVRMFTGTELQLCGRSIGINRLQFTQAQ